MKPDSILFWNAVALEADRISHSDPAKMEQNGPVLSSRALAIIHLAMYDAYAAIIGGAPFPRYLAPPAIPIPPVPPAPAPDSSVANAIAGAAHRTLSRLYKAQKDFFDAQLSCFDQTDPYFDFGVEVGTVLLEFRQGDPGNGDCGYEVSPKRGRHRVDPDNPGQGFLAPFYGFQSRVFAVSTRHKLSPPPFGNGTDPTYKNALKETRAKGIKPELMATLLPTSLFNDRRNAEQTTIGVYWAYDGANRLGTPPRLYNQIIRKVAMKQDNSEGDNARLFAFVNAAMGDAGILAWEQKYCHDFWRPVVGIREHDESFGPAAIDADAANKIDANADPFWLPLGAPSTNRPMMKNFTPNFPAYPSGHATFGAAAFHITRLFYGKGFETGGTPVIPGGKPIIKGGNLVKDDLFDELGFVSDELNGMNQDNQGTVRPRHVRNFDFDTNNKPLSGGLGRMIIENAKSRIYLGVHWRFDAFAGNMDKPDFSTEEALKVGGVPLGLKIAEDIFKTGAGKAPKIPPPPAQPPNPPNPTDPPVKSSVIMQPADVLGCADNPTAAKTKKTKDKKTKDEKAKEAAEEKRKVETPYPDGISPR